MRQAFLFARGRSLDMLGTGHNKIARSHELASSCPVCPELVEGSKRPRRKHGERVEGHSFARHLG